ncbi:hypothetical protein HW555_001328 [Spodoptera exigua]|uniref:Uncharacterized protein n=1 Tax=Spodoptera exigua TaxID=7107 RepID=A0A835GSB5_SPOEX|nr:hypothetical protein HW555_001328 [Spodoptera exigua]
MQIGQAPEYEEVIKAARAGNWEQVQKIGQPYDEIQASYNEDDVLNSNLGKQAGWMPPSFDSLRELKPENGGHVYGEAEYAYHSASNINGRTTEQSVGHKIINEDGRVKEFDFTPSTDYSPVIQPVISPIIQKAGDYGAASYNQQYAGSGAGKPNIAGQRLNNNLQPDYYPRNSANLALPVPPKKKYNSTNSPDVEYEYVLTSGTEDEKPAREINVSEENKHNILNGADQDIETEQTNNPTPVATLEPRKEKSKLNDADYIAYVASAIEDRLDRISQKLKKNNVKKSDSNIFMKTTKSPKKEHSQRFLDAKPSFPISFDKKYAYKNSSSYLDDESPKRSFQKKKSYAKSPKRASHLSFTNVRDLKPPQGGHIYGEAQYAYHTASNINGKKSEDSGGHKIINNDGKIKEFDFTPKPKFGPVSYY